jgi:formyl-CoA transferase
LAGAISAALFRRERTGKGGLIEHSLYLIGIYIMSQSLIGASVGWERGPGRPRTEVDALSNVYRSKDDRWLVLCLLYDSWWPDFARTLGHPEWLTDPRYVDVAARQRNCGALVAELDEIFASRTLAEWEEALVDLEGVWSPLKSPGEVIADPQALVNGYVAPVTMADGEEYVTGASPAQFDGTPIGALRAAPLHGTDTEDVMRELGLADDVLADLRARQIIL